MSKRDLAERKKKLDKISDEILEHENQTHETQAQHHKFSQDQGTHKLSQEYEKASEVQTVPDESTQVEDTPVGNPAKKTKPIMKPKSKQKKGNKGKKRTSIVAPEPEELPTERKYSTDENETSPYNDSKVIVTTSNVHLSELVKSGNVEVKQSSSPDDEEAEFHHIVEAFKCLEGDKLLFMQRIIDYLDVESAGISFGNKKVDLAYQILNLEGQILYLIQVEKVKCTGFILYAHKSFEQDLFDLQGNKILKFIGPSIFMSKTTSKMLVTDARDRTLGYVKAFGRKVNYSVYNALGERLFLVVSNLFLPSSTATFTILCRGEKIGVIKYGWKESYPELQFIDYETSGIEFPVDMDTREKVLLLGCLMLIEFFWFSPLTKLKVAVFCVGIIALVIIIIVICIPIIVDSPKPDEKTHPFYYENHETEHDAAMKDKPKVTWTR